MMFKLMILSFVFLAMAGAVRAENPIVAIETSLGTFKVELFQDKAPISVKNFLGYVDDKFYDGTVFHRVMGKENNNGQDFMIQGGGFEPGMKQKKTKDPIKNEADNKLSNLRGTLAMARTNVVDSATAQFFVNVGDNLFLDHKGPAERFGYAVFGRVTEGMDVVDKIKAVETGTKEGFQNVPVKDVVIKSIRRVEKK